MRKQTFWVGASSLISALFFFSVLDTTNKYLMASVPLGMILWFRYTTHCLISTGLLLPKKGRAIFRTQQIFLQIVRGALLLMSSIFAFLSLKRMPVAEFAAIGMLTPLFVMLLSYFFLDEPFSWLGSVCVIGALCGATILVRPGGNLNGWDAAFPLAMSICNSVYQVLTSYLSRKEDPMTLNLFTGWVGFFISSLFVYFFWDTDLSVNFWLLMCLSGLTGTLGHFLLIKGFSNAPANRLAPYLYLQVVFSWLTGYIVFDYNPQGLDLLGILLICLFGVASACWGKPKAMLPPTSH
jgi:drug/metabolite transporter (DMT)-like permease